jgi:CDP-glycerol glycerophosphotransferase (TagB/SpsB family)
MKRYLFYASQLYSFAILRPLQEQILKNGDQVAWFFGNPEAAIPNLKKGEICLQTVSEVKAYNPYAVFAPGNVLPDFFPGVKVQLFHGLPTGKRGKASHYRLRGFFDLHCTLGSADTETFKQLARKHGYFCVEQTGWPKLDPLFSGEPQENPPFQLEAGKPTVLFGSTFTPRHSAARTLLPTIQALSSTGRWHWLVTLHPKMEKDVINSYRALAGPHLDFIESHHELTPLLQAADVMLCDTSSIGIEFQMLDKPLVTFRTKVPGPHLIDVDTPGDVEAALAKALTRPVQLMEQTNIYIDRMHPFRDGQSSQRVLDAVDRFVTERQSGLRKKPLNLWRRFKIRRNLGYYRM